MRSLVPLVLAVAIGVLVTPIVALGLLVFGANEANPLVAVVVTVAENLVEPFRGIFTLDDPQLTKWLSWALAALFYLILANALSKVFRGGH